MIFDAAIASSFLQPLNASASTVALSGMLMEVKAVQPLNAKYSKLVMQSGMTIVLRDLQL